tara:strand:+ start:1901 stop:2119 length:219 start_codon:yes stop_codon:yes gene_type:complete
MLKQEIVYIPKEVVDNGTFPRHLKGFKPKEGYFFTQEELQKLLEDTYFEGECFGIGADGCISKQDYINNLFK